MIKVEYKMFFDYTKEEHWLSDMSEKGYALISTGRLGKHTFQKTEPQKYIYRIDYRDFKNTSDFEDYRTLFEDSGWMHLWGTKNSGTQYFVQIRENALNDVFSDAASKAGRYKRLYSMWLSLTTTFLPILVALYMTSQYKLTALTNPKALYLTPGLWEMSGWRFWRAFLFETPFAFGRGFMWLLFLIIIALYFAAFLKAFILYRRYSKGTLSK